MSETPLSRCVHSQTTRSTPSQQHFTGAEQTSLPLFHGGESDVADRRHAIDTVRALINSRAATIRLATTFLSVRIAEQLWPATKRTQSCRAVARFPVPLAGQRAVRRTREP